MQSLSSSDSKVVDMLHRPDQGLLKTTGLPGPLITLILKGAKTSITELLTQQLPNHIMYGVAP